MTTPDPSRAAFEQWYIEDAQSLNISLRDWTREELMRAYLERRQSGLYRSESANSEWKVWQAAMAHKGAEGGGPITPTKSPQTLMDACSDPGPNNGWQPIETAPSYTTILVLGTSGMVVAYKDSYGDWKADGVDFTYDMAYTVLQIGKLTHWAPLPAAPKQEGST